MIDAVEHFAVELKEMRKQFADGLCIFGHKVALEIVLAVVNGEFG